MNDDPSDLESYTLEYANILDEALDTLYPKPGDIDEEEDPYDAKSAEEN